MKAIQEPLKESSEYQQICQHLKNCKGKSTVIGVNGCIDSQQVNFINSIAEKYKYSVVITYSDKRAREIYEDYLLYGRNVIYYPAKDFIFYNADIHGNLTMTERLGAIRRIIE